MPNGSRRRTARLLALLACALAIAASVARGEDAQPAVDLDARATAALRGAADALARGDRDDAAQRFDAIAAQFPELADHAGALAAQTWLVESRAPRAEASARQALQRNPDSPIAAVLFDALAQSLAAQGNAAGARDAWRQALLRNPGDAGDAMRLALGTSLADAGDVDASARELRTLWIEAAGRPASDAAAQQLAALEARAGRPLRSGTDWSRRADRLYERQHSEAALGAYDAALATTTLGDAERRSDRRRRADCLFRLRRYREAEAAFASLGADPDARVWRARAAARAGRSDDAVAQLEAIGGESDGPISAWARYLAGLLYEDHDPARAATLFAASVNGADEKVAMQALWKLGWSAYTNGETATARRRFRALAARSEAPLDRLAGRYWAARALAADEPEEAQRELSAIAAEYPFSYYGWRASQRIAGAPPAPRPPIADGPSALADRDLFAARVLAAAGLRDAALRAVQPLAARAASVADRIAVGRIQAAAGDPHAAQLLVVDAYAEPLARGVAAGQEELWRLAWPDAFASERRAARPAGARLDPWFVASIMREESTFQPDAVSTSGALGLVQLMPDTAQRLAREAAIADFAPPQLVDPALNLKLGSLYLERLAGQFEAMPEAVAASYNAGPEVVAKWRAGAPRPADEWVESIPYDETRGYAKRVLRSLHVYRTLYP